MLHLIGGSGRLGHALVRSHPAGGVRLLAREIYAEWWREGASDAVARYFGTHAQPGDSVCVLSGVLDPCRSEVEHERVNLALPMQIIEGNRATGVTVLTFGSVMEGLIAKPNRYIAAKARLGHAVADRAARGESVLHMRIHTLYGGGEPAPFMLLGQMLAALRGNKPFEMSSGRQLREYHHVDDDAQALHLIIGEELRGTVDLNHGAALSLRALASGVFGALGCESLLRIGALPDPAEDNFGTVFERLPLLQPLRFRETVPSVTQELQRLLSTKAPACGAITRSPRE